VPVCVKWFNPLLFLPGGSCIALPLQLCLVSSSPSKVGQFSFEYCPQSHWTSSGIYHGPNVGGWLVASPCSQCLFHTPPSLSESSAPCHTPFLRGLFSSPLPPLSVVDYNSLFLFLSFVQGWGLNLLRGCARLCFQAVGGGVTCGAWSSLLGQQIYAGSFETS
jgi:hypothetical protein